MRGKNYQQSCVCRRLLLRSGVVACLCRGIIVCVGAVRFAIGYTWYEVLSCARDVFVFGVSIFFGAVMGGVCFACLYVCVCPNAEGVLSTRGFTISPGKPSFWSAVALAVVWFVAVFLISLFFLPSTYPIVSGEVRVLDVRRDELEPVSE